MEKHFPICCKQFSDEIGDCDYAVDIQLDEEV